MKLGQTSVIHFVSQVVMSVAGFAANLYIARELGPNVHGTYFLTISIIYWVSIAGDLGIDASVRKRLSEEQTEPTIIASAMSIKAGLYVAVASVILLASPIINDYVGAPVAEWLAGMLFARLAINFIIAVLDGQHKVHLSSVLTPIDWTLRSLFQILLAVIGFSLAGLFMGYIGAGIIAVGVGLYFATLRFGIPTREDVSRLVSFAKYSWLGSLKDLSFRSMDTIVLGAFVVNDLIGIYEITWNLASLFAIFGASVSRAVFPEISSAGEMVDERVRDLTSASLAYAGLFLIPGFVGAVFVGDVVLKIYGAAYAKGYEVLVILVLSRLVYAYLAQLLSVVNALDRPDIAFRVNLAFFLLNLVLNVVFISQFGWVGAAVATTLSALFGLALGYRGLSDVLTVSVPYREIGRQVFAAAVMGIVVYAGRSTFGDSFLVVIPLILVGGAVYFGTLFGVSSQFRKTVKDNLPAV